MPKKVKKCDLEKTIRFCFEEVYSVNKRDFDKKAVNIEIDSVSATLTYNHKKENILCLENFENKQIFEKFEEYLSAYFRQFTVKILKKQFLIITVDYDIVD